MPANLRKTAPQRRFMPKLPIRHPHVGIVPLHATTEQGSGFQPPASPCEILASIVEGGRITRLHELLEDGLGLLIFSGCIEGSRALVDKSQFVRICGQRLVARFNGGSCVELEHSELHAHVARYSLRVIRIGGRRIRHSCGASENSPIPQRTIGSGLASSDEGMLLRISSQFTVAPLRGLYSPAARQLALQLRESSAALWKISADSNFDPGSLRAQNATLYLL